MLVTITTGDQPVGTSVRAQCRLCKDVIEVTVRHSRAYCKCKEIFVDGSGIRGAKDMNNIIDMSREEGLVE